MLLHALVLALAGVLLVGCTSGPAEVSLARLAHEQEAFSGEKIKTHGIVRKFDDASGEHYGLKTMS